VNDPQDGLNLVVTLIAFLASKEIAALVGPNAAIIVLASSGAAFALSCSIVKRSYLSAMWFIILRVIVASLLTVTLAEIIQYWVPWMKPRYGLVLLAFGIGLIEDYRALLGVVLKGKEDGAK